MQLTVAQLSNFDTIVQNIISTWQKIKPLAGGWFGVDKNSLNKALATVITGVDQLVSFASTLEVPGADKKAAVLASANTLFSTIVLPLLPTWAKPFSSILVTIFDSVLDVLIEYVVSRVLKV